MAQKSYYDCIGVIQKAAGEGSISQKDAEHILEQIDKLYQVKATSGKIAGVEHLMLNELGAVTDAIKEAALIEKRNALINLKVREQVLAFARTFDKPGDGLKALLGGVHTNKKGAMYSIDAQGKALQDGTLGKMIHAMEKEGVLQDFTSGVFDKEIARELWELPHGKPGVTGNESAIKIAKILNSIQNDLVYRQNRAGAYIKLLPGYIVRQSHDMFKIRATSVDDWIKTVLPLLDAEKTFGTANPKDFLTEAYHGFTSGMHYKVRGDDAADSVTYFLGFKGPSNLARKLSEQRVLHFKDADSWYQYNEQFGHESMREALIHGIEHDARNIALMENLGTNPLSMIDTVLGKLRHEYKTDLPRFDSLKDNPIHNLYMQLDGTAHIPVNHTGARISAMIRSVQNMAKLGMSTISSITDIPFQAANLRLNGVNIMSAYTNAFMNVLRGRGSSEQKEIARLIGVGFEGIIKSVSSRFSTQDDVPGLMAKMQQKYFKLNAMNWWNDSHKSGVALMLSNHVAESVNTSIDQLPQSMRTILQQYNIGEREWKLGKEMVFKAEDGYSYLTPDKVKEISDSRLIQDYGVNQDAEASVISRELTRIRDTLESQWRTYFIDQANHAIPHPGAAEHANPLLGGGTQPGTVLGEAMRFIGQFKSFPLTVLRKGVGMHLYNEGASNIKEALFKGKGDLAGLVHLMVATTVFGYLAGAAKDFLRGLEPAHANDPKTWVRAFAQGGGLGIYGDFLFGEFNKYGQSAIATLSGPTLSNAEDILKIYSRMKDGDKFAGQMMRTAINNVPFANLFYTRMAMDYLFLYQLQESVNPGYLSRLESRIMNESNRKFYFPPSQQIPYGGGDRLFEGVR